MSHVVNCRVFATGLPTRWVVRLPSTLDASAMALRSSASERGQGVNFHLILRTARWGAVYFAVLFGVGFALGLIRVPVLEPRLGVRAAELLEAPLMFIAIVLTGRWIGRQLHHGYSTVAKLAVGVLAAGLILVADLAVGVGLRGMTVLEVFTSRDPVSGLVYYALVGLSAIAPWLMSHSRVTGA